MNGNALPNWNTFSVESPQSIETNCRLTLLCLCWGNPPKLSKVYTVLELSGHRPGPSWGTDALKQSLQASHQTSLITKLKKLKSYPQLLYMQFIKLSGVLTGSL